MKILQFWKKFDSEIFWFGFYGHLKMRKFRNFEDFRKLTIFKIFAKSTTFFFSNIFCFSMNFRTSFTSCRENWTFFRPKKCIFCEMNFAGDKKIQKKLIFSIFLAWGTLSTQGIVILSGVVVVVVVRRSFVVRSLFVRRCHKIVSPPKI